MTETAVAKPKRRSEITEQPDWAVTERNRKIQYTELEVDTALRIMVSCGGSPTRTEEQLRGEGINVKRTTLQNWRDYSFPRRYMQLRTELSAEVAERIAGAAMERAMEADEAEQAYIEAAKEKLHEVDPNHLAKAVLSLAQAKSKNIEGAQLLRNLPTEIRKVDLSESLEVLKRLKVAEVVGEEIVDAEVVEDA